MGTTGLIYAAIVAVWAAYLVPLWLRRHDEESDSRSADRFSTAMRVLARRQAPTADPEAMDRARDTHAPGESELTAGAADVADARAADRVGREHSDGISGGIPTNAADDRPDGALRGFTFDYEQSSSPATRRRRTLVSLIAVTSGLAVFAAVGVLPWWACLSALALNVGFLALSARASARERASLSGRAGRVSAREAPADGAASAPSSQTSQANRANRARQAGQASRSGPATSSGSGAPSGSGRSSREETASTSTTTPGPGEAAGPGGSDEVVATLPDDFAPPPRDENLWDPREIPLPTYVTKEKASTSRRIELGDHGYQPHRSLLDESIEPGGKAADADQSTTGIQDELYDRELDGDWDDHRPAVGDS